MTPLFVGRPVRVYGAYAASGTFTATAVQHARPDARTWPADG